MNNRVNIDNYEIFVLDYLEGRLTEEERIDVRNFVLLHPELNLDLETEFTKVDPESVLFTNKHSIKRENTPVELEILEYLENTLSPFEKEQFEQKLQQEPLYAEELKAFQKTKLPADSEPVFAFKNELKKSEDELFLNNRFIQYLEGEFTPEELQAFEKEMQAPELSKELSLYRMTLLQPELSLVFEKKEQLKKEALVLPLFRARVVYSFAASLVLLVVLGFVFRFYLNTEEVSVQPVLSSTETLPIPTTNSLRPDSPILSTPKLSPKAIPAVATIRSLKESRPHLSDTVTLSSGNLVQSTTKEEVPSENLLLASNTPTIETEKSNSALTETESQNLIAFENQYMIPFEEEEGDADEETTSQKRKSKGFWNLAIRLAQKANQIGIKSVNGSENDQQQYLLSFHALTIEKK